MNISQVTREPCRKGAREQNRLRLCVLATLLLCSLVALLLFCSARPVTAAPNGPESGADVSRQVIWGGGAAKSAAIETPLYGQTVTYTIALRDMAVPLTTPLTLTDVVPADLAYLPGSLSASAGTVDESHAPELRWTGALTPTPAVTITYAVTVTTRAVSRPIVNTATIAASGYTPITRTAVVTANHHHVYAPFLMRATDSCSAIPGVSYGSLAPLYTPPPSHDIEVNPDYRLTVLGYTTVDEYMGLVDYTGATDDLAPQFDYLFADRRLPAFLQTYRVNGWDWEQMIPTPPSGVWPVTALGLGTESGEIVHVPHGGRTINAQYGYEVLVLYADQNEITLKYTLQDNIANGYTIYIAGVCTEPSLLALYQSLDAAGRHELPALAGGQPLGRARGGEIVVTIRDSAEPMDPRSRKDWWSDH